MPSKKQNAKEALDADWRSTSRDMKNKFLERSGKLWDAHFGEAKSILDDAEKPVINFTFKASMDFSESEATLETTLRFSEVHTDGASDTFENPRPGAELPGVPLPGVDNEAKEESKKVRAKKRKAKESKSDGEPEEAPHVVDASEVAA